MATSGSSNDKRNFQCVTVASVDVIKLPLRDILASRIQPKDLFPKIQLSSTLKLRPDQKKICFIPPPGVPDYNKFDVTLLYTLIRNLCSLPCPAQGWGNEPRTTDTQISDDIERLRLFRNNCYAHAESAVISDAVFKDVWRDLKLVFRRIQPKKGCSVDYEEELRNIERTTFTDEYFSTFRVLLEAFVTLEKQTDDRDEPTVSIQGENEIMWGDTAHFEADVKKAESSCWSITWHRRRGCDIKCIDTSVEKYSGSTKRKLVINSVCKEDEGEYKALLSFESKGIYYQSRNVIRLNVIGDVPSVRIFVDSPVCFGSETIIKSVVSSTPTPEKTEWQKSKDGTDFHLIGKPNIYFGSNENFRNPFLVIPKTTFADKLFYRLVVWNRVGISASNTSFLNVTGSPPNITTSFVTNIENKSVKLMGEVYFLENSPGILKTFWTKNGKKINIKESAGKLSELITDNPSLTITNVGPDDAGEYKLTAVNAIGSTTSEVIVLGIPSVFSERVEDGKNGGQRITVTITSFPTPCQIQWNATSKDNDTFTPIDISAEEYDGTTVTFPHPVLVVKQRDQLEKNCYQIEVTNFIGKIVQTISAAYLGLRTTQSFKERSPSTGVPLRNQVTSSPPGVFAPISAISDSSEPDDKQVDRQHAALYRTSSPHASKGIQEETEHERLPPGQDPGPLTGLSGANSNLIESLADVDGALKVTAHVDEELQNLRAMEQKTLSKTMEKKIINDPIWGPIKLDPLCMEIIDTPQFQRLRHIKQLGGCSFVFPGACHNRFEHSIGTAHLARMMGDELQKKHTKETITDQEILCLEVAGLCHDLGHGPFSHVFDQQFQNKCKGKKWTHEDLSIKMLDKVFETLERSVDLKELIGDKGEELIKDLIEPSRALRKEKPFLYEIISNEENKIDVDKWDYFSRDCHMLGLHHNFQCQRSIKLARIVENHISFPKSEYFNLFDMFYTRFTLHRRAYQHPVVKAVEMMIADAFLKADNYLTFLPVGNPGEDAGKENKKVPKPLSESMDCMDTYQGVTDDVLQQIRRLELDTDKNSDKHKNVKAAQDIIDRIYCRDLYTLIGEKRVKWDTETIKSGSCGKEITKKLIEADCKSSSFEIEEAVFHYGNKNEDPMSDVNFYHKKKDEKDMNRSKLYELVKGNVMKKDPEISDMLPEKFQQIYIRLYWKGSKSDDIKKQEIKDAFSRITDVQVQVKEEDEEKEITVKFADTKSYKD